MSGGDIEQFVLDIAVQIDDRTREGLDAIQRRVTAFADAAQRQLQRIQQVQTGSSGATMFDAEVQRMEQMFRDLPGKLLSPFTTLWAGVVSRTQAAFATISGIFTVAGALVGSVAARIETFATGLFANVVRGAGAIGRTMVSAVSIGVGALPPVLRQATAGVTALGHIAGAALGSVASTVTGAIGSGVGKLASAFPTIARGVTSFVSSAVGSVGSALGSAMSSVTNAIGATISKAVGSAGSALGSVLGGAGSALGGLLGLPGKLLSIPGLIAAKVSGAFAQGAIATPLAMAGELEQAQIGFATFIQREEKARGNMIDFGKATQLSNSYLDQLRDFANYTPYEFPQVREAAKNFMAVGMSRESVIPLLTAMGNATSGLGLNGEALDRFSMSLMQMRSRGRVTGEELREMAHLGVPALEILTKGWQKLHPEVIRNQDDMRRAIEQGIVPARTSILLLEQGMNEMFPNMMERSSRTLPGLMSSIKDVFNNNIVVAWGQGLATAVEPRLAKLVDWFTANKRVTDAWANGLRTLGGSFGGAIMSAVEAVTKVIGTSLASDKFLNEPTFMGKIKILAGDIKTALFGGGAGGQAGQGLFGDVFQWIKDRVGELRAALTEFVTTKWNDFSAMVAKKFDEFKTDAMEAWETFKKNAIDKFEEFKGNAVTKFEEWKAAFFNWVDPAWEGFKTLVNTQWNALLDLIDEALASTIPWYKRKRGGGGGGASGGGDAGGGGGFSGGGVGAPTTTRQAATAGAISTGMAVAGQRFVDLGGGLNAAIDQCERFVEILYGVTGQFNTAREAGDRMMSASAGGMRFAEMGRGTAPRGSQAFFDTGIPAGHTALSTGEGFLEMGPTGAANVTAETNPERYRYLQEHLLGYGWANYGTAAGREVVKGQPTLAKAAEPYLAQMRAMVTKYKLAPMGYDLTTMARQFWQESGFQPDIISGAKKGSSGEIGIGQFMPDTGASVAKQLGVSSEQFFSDTNTQIEGTAFLMNHLLNKYRDAQGKPNLQMALAAYNAGEGRVDASGGEFDRLPTSTQQYVKNIAGGEGAGGPVGGPSALPLAAAPPGGAPVITIANLNISVNGAADPAATGEATLNAFLTAAADQLRLANQNTPPQGR